MKEGEKAEGFATLLEYTQAPVKTKKIPRIAIANNVGSAGTAEITR